VFYCKVLLHSSCLRPCIDSDDRLEGFGGRSLVCVSITQSLFLFFFGLFSPILHRLWDYNEQVDHISANVWEVRDLVTGHLRPHTKFENALELGEGAYWVNQNIQGPV